VDGVLHHKGQQLLDYNTRLDKYCVVGKNGDKNNTLSGKKDRL